MLSSWWIGIALRGGLDYFLGPARKILVVAKGKAYTFCLFPWKFVIGPMIRVGSPTSNQTFIY